MGFCRNCGSARDDYARFCASCGSPVVGEPPASPSGFRSTIRSGSSSAHVPPSMSARSDKFCVSCGEGLIGSAVVCPRCGSGAPVAGYPKPTTASFGSPAKKEKTVALLLAIFVGHFAWLYTYDRDQQKFWIGTGIFVGGLILMIVLIGFFMWLGLWVWVIVDVVQKSDDWYNRYPVG